MFRRFAVVLFAILLLAVPCVRADQNASGGLRENAPRAARTVVAKAVAQICPAAAILRGANGEVAGCKTCPPGTAYRRFGGTGWVLGTATTGHYTLPGTSNLLLEGGGCDPHSDNWGGTYVFALKAGAPKLLRYDPGLMTSPCRQLRLRGGRDFLVCQDERLGQGYLSMSIYSLVFDSSGKGQRTFLFETHDDLGACGNVPFLKSDLIVQASQIRSVEFPDLNGDGHPDLSITVTLGRKALTEAQWKGCATGSYDLSDSLVPQKLYTAKYIFDGAAFHPTPAARKVLKLFDKLPQSR